MFPVFLMYEISRTIPNLKCLAYFEVRVTVVILFTQNVWPPIARSSFSKIKIPDHPFFKIVVHYL